MDEVLQERLVRMLALHEDLRLKPYRDSVGKLTIGIGRNLDDVGISKTEAYVLVMNDIAAAESALRMNLSWFDALDEVRRCVLVDMCFNLGWTRLSEFQRTLTAIQLRDFEHAADFMLDSKWAQQVGSRADRLALMMRTGLWYDAERT